MKALAARRPRPVEIIFEFGPELEKPARRFFFDQFEVPRLCQELRCEALLSTNNFGSLVSPVRQVLLVRNPIFFSPLFLRRLAREGKLKTKAETLVRRNLILESIRAAEASVFPTRAMLEDCRRWLRRPSGRPDRSCSAVPAAAARSAAERCRKCPGCCW